MPRLLVFLPCERVIISQEENTVSLISVLEVINLAVPPELEIKEDSDRAVPFRWYILAVYRMEDGDENKQFEGRVQLNKEDRTYLDVSLPFQFQPDKPNMRTTMQIGGFPVMPLGNASLKLSLREVAEGNDWQEIADYPLIIKIQGRGE